MKRRASTALLLCVSYVAAHVWRGRSQAGFIVGSPGAWVRGTERSSVAAVMRPPKGGDGRHPREVGLALGIPTAWLVGTQRLPGRGLCASVAPPEVPESTKAPETEVIIERVPEPAGPLESAAEMLSSMIWPPADAAALRKWVNLSILAVLGAAGVGLFVTVDSEVWRGWTWQEILLRIPYDNWNAYEGGLMTHPILTKTIINIVIYLLGDWMSQVEWGRTGNVLEFDLARTLRNGLIGAFFGPLVHWYYEFSDVILPMDVPINRILKIVMDQSVYFVSKCSAYIALVGLLRGDSGEQVVSDVRQRLWPVVSRGWRFWPLAHIVTYGVIPPRHRVLWVNCLDLIWSSILASLASSSSNNTTKAQAGTTAPAEAAAAAAVTVGDGSTAQVAQVEVEGQQVVLVEHNKESEMVEKVVDGLGME